MLWFAGQSFVLRSQYFGSSVYNEENGLRPNIEYRVRIPMGRITMKIRRTLVESDNFNVKTLSY